MTMVEDDDPVVSEHDIYISTQLATYLHVVQMPQTLNELAGHHRSLPLKYKKESKVMELDFPLDVHHETYSKSRGEELASQSMAGRVRLHGEDMDGPGTKGGKLGSVTLSGGPLPSNPDVKYFVGTMANGKKAFLIYFMLLGALHMTPIDKFIALKPHMKHLDEADAKTKVAAKKADADAPTQSAALKAVQVQFKKRETEEQLAARLSSYAYLQRKVDDEPWIRMSHFLPVSEESASIADRLLASTDAPLEFKQ